jgi:hypothetical protein
MSSGANATKKDEYTHDSLPTQTMGGLTQQRSATEEQRQCERANVGPSLGQPWERYPRYGHGLSGGRMAHRGRVKSTLVRPLLKYSMTEMFTSSQNEEACSEGTVRQQKKSEINERRVKRPYTAELGLVAR